MTNEEGDTLADAPASAPGPEVGVSDVEQDQAATQPAPADDPGPGSGQLVKKKRASALQMASLAAVLVMAALEFMEAWMGLSPGLAALKKLLASFLE